MLSYSQKSKCQGCKALCSTKSEYTCGLGFKLTFTQQDNMPWMPKPLERCYKPKSTKEFREANKLIQQKAPAKSEA